MSVDKHLDYDQCCFLCFSTNAKQCEFCPLYYCSEAHLRIHRPHDYCHPFRVGRYVVATRAVSAGELILADSAAVLGPDGDTGPVCLECLVGIQSEEEAFLCPECGLPLCSEACYKKSRGESGLHKLECSMFKEVPTGFHMKVNFNRPFGPEERRIAPEYTCITPLRLLLKKKSDPELWKRLDLLMDHDEQRNMESTYWKMFKVNVLDFLCKTCGFDSFSSDDVYRVIGLIRTNGLHVEFPHMKRSRTSGRAVFPTFSFLSHSCISNAKYSVHPNYKVYVRAQSDIRAGDEVTIQYLSFMFGQLKRKSDIVNSWYFTCKCRRCQDPSELGSYMSAMRCTDSECPGDVLPLPEDDLSAEKDWKCNACSSRQSAASIEKYVENCDRILHDTFEHDVDRYEELLEQFSARLRPTHYIMIIIKKFLGDLYGHLQGYDLNENRLDKKILYLEEFLRTIEKVDPGYPKWRGSVLYELHRPLLVRSNRDFSQGAISKEDFLQELKKISALLNEALQCLGHEPEGSKEQRVAASSKKALANINEILAFSSFI